MKNKFIYLLAILMASSITVCASPESLSQPSLIDQQPMATSTPLLFGAYDPHGDFKNDKNISIEHIFLPWEDVDLSTLETADTYATQRKRALLITVEPWSWLARSKVSPEQLYQGIMANQYDSNITAICTKTATLKSPVTIRWAQEMENHNGHFIWSSWKPEQFINAYRHFVSLCRKSDKKVHFMWSPKGAEGAEAYYPGSEYVDVIGLTLFALQKRDRNEIGRDRSFTEMLTPLYQRVVRFNKPIFIAEFGYDGDAAYIHDWAQSVAKPLHGFPMLKGVVYYDAHEVYPWPNGYGLPNWRVAEKLPTK